MNGATAPGANLGWGVQMQWPTVKSMLVFTVNTKENRGKGSPLPTATSGSLYRVKQASLHLLHSGHITKIP